MKSLLQLNRIRVENANAISGMTWGFPGITHFLGMTHALSRFVYAQHGLHLGGCGVISHWHEVKAHQPSGVGEYVFALTRNPLVLNGQDAVTAPFNEEGKMHMEVSLLIECDFLPRHLAFNSGNPEEDAKRFAQQIQEQLLTMRLAGGTILSVQSVELDTVPDDTQRWARKKLLRLLPGYALISRHDALQQHHAVLQQDNPKADLLDAWLDFIALRYKAEPTQEAEPDENPEPTKALTVWSLQPKPTEGWLVPIHTGYQGISPLYAPGDIAHARDPSIPFRFVEGTYSVGQWLSPHRLQHPEQLIWRYQHQEDLYLCVNSPSLTPHS